MIKHTFSGFADEISRNLDEQIEVLKELGIGFLELRSVDKINISDFTVDFANKVKAKLDENNIKVSAIGSPIGKIKITDEFEPHFEKFKHVVMLSKLFETKYIRMFSFYIEQGDDPEIYFDEVVSRLSKMIEYAKENGVVLLHENEKEIYGDTHTRCKKLFDTLGCESFRCTYDPANFVQCNCDTVEAFELLKENIEYMHIKDARYSDGLVVPPGKGDGQIKKLIEKLDKMNYCGFISLEPHLRVFAGLEALENGQTPLVDTSSQYNGPSGFRFAHKCLSEIINSVI